MNWKQMLALCKSRKRITFLTVCETRNYVYIRISFCLTITVCPEKAAIGYRIVALCLLFQSLVPCSVRHWFHFYLRNAPSHGWTKSREIIVSKLLFWECIDLTSHSACKFQKIICFKWPFVKHVFFFASEENNTWGHSFTKSHFSCKFI